MHNQTSRNPAKTDTPRDTGWYRQPVVWLGIAIFTASIAGCIWMIVLGIQHEDPAIPLDGHSIMRVPVERAPVEQNRSPETEPPVRPEP